MRLFLVEDEVIALRSLQAKIQDLSTDYQIVGTACNGAEALRLIPAAKPDVVLTDIRMPDMDGITLIQHLKDRGSQVLPVIVSGYQEFDYAKQAVRLGVEDYLLKPVDPAELETCLQHCAQSLKSKRSKDNVTTFLLGDDSISIETPPGENRFAVVYLIISNALSDLEHLQHPSVPFFPSAEIEALLAPLFPAETALHCMDGFFSNEKALVLSGPGLEPPGLEAKLQRASAALREKTGYFTTMLYCTIDSSRKLESTIRACRRGAVGCIRLGADVVACKPPRPATQDEKLAERVRLFSLFLRQNELDALYKNLQRMFADWHKAQRTMAAVTADLAFIINSLNHNPALRQDIPFSGSFYVENLLCFSADEQEFAQGFYQLLLELFHPGQDEKKGLSAEELVDQIDTYLHANLAENLSLQTLSEEMGLSKVYLCRIFKKQKDMTPIDYFTRLKIDRASRMIVEYPTMPLREIADALGFNDTYYFSKVFKRIAGVPPSELRGEK